MHVRMAERSKAPDSRVKSLPTTTREHSGPRMWAWVRIPLLTRFSDKRHCFYISSTNKNKNLVHRAGFEPAT